VMNIRRMITEVAGVVESTVTSSSEINKQVENITTGSHIQAQNVGELHHSIEQIKQSIIDMAGNIHKVSEKAIAAGSKAKYGGEIVKESIIKIEQINKIVGDLELILKNLGNSSEKIGAIVEVINDIADQTNLLALNASIEAARAGENGRGFAVVADEVRKLSENTSNATKEIEGMIKAIQNETKTALNSMKIGRETVNSGKESVNNSGIALAEIIMQTEEVASVIMNVAAAAEEQSATSASITQNAEQIEVVVKDANDSIMQINNAVLELNNLADSLSELISNFKFRKDDKVTKWKSL